MPKSHESVLQVPASTAAPAAVSATKAGAASPPNPGTGVLPSAVQSAAAAGAAAGTDVIELQRESNWSWTRFAYVFIIVVIVAITSFMAGTAAGPESTSKALLKATAVSVPMALTAAVLAH